MQSGPVTLTYIVGVLVCSICLVPLLFLFVPSAEKARPEPEGNPLQRHDDNGSR